MNAVDTAITRLKELLDFPPYGTEEFYQHRINLAILVILRELANRGGTGQPGMGEDTPHSRRTAPPQP